MTRYFTRCSDCCAVQAIEADRFPAKLTCDCGGTVTNMGQVLGQKLVQFQSRTPCDARCTHATGPKCDCPCRGDNHGTQRVVTVQIDQGGIPRISTPCPERAGELRALIQDIRRACDVRYPAPGGWMPEQVYWGRRSTDDAIYFARTLKTHNNRLKALREILDGLGKGPA